MLCLWLNWKWKNLHNARRRVIISTGAIYIGNRRPFRLFKKSILQIIYIYQKEYQHLTVWLSFYEIYCGKLFDLLNNRAILVPREDSKQDVNIVGLQEKRVTSSDQLMGIIAYGTGERVTAQNSANSESSRSHAILQINIRDGNNIHGKMSFIDLAGSERGADV